MRLDGKCHRKLTGSLLKNKKQKNKFSINSMSRWGSITYRGLLRIVDAATWPGTCSTARRTKVYISTEQKHPFSHNVLIFTVAKPGGQVETSAGNLSKSQLVLILENEEWKSPDWSSTVLTMTRARKNDSLNRQNTTGAGLLSLYPSRYPSSTKHQ